MKLFKTSLILAFMIAGLFAVRPAQAQLLDYGLKGGMNFSTLSDADYSEYLIGYHFGAFVNISPPLSPIGIQPELIYTRLGTEFEMPGTMDPITGVPEIFEETLTIDYIQIPVLLKYYLPLPGPVGPHLFAGPYYGLMIESDFESDHESDVEEFEPAIEDRVRESDYGIVLGAGTEISVLLSTIYVEGRFILGMENVFEDEFENDEKNRSIAISVGFAF